MDATNEIQFNPYIYIKSKLKNLEMKIIGKSSRVRTILLSLKVPFEVRADIKQVIPCIFIL